MSVVEAKSLARPHPPRAGACVLVLLAGGTAPAPVCRVLGCSLLDLEVEAGRTLLQWWAMRDWCGDEEPRLVRTTRGAGSPAPAQPGIPADWHAAGRQAPTVEHFVDAAGPRGSAGALRDACDADAPETTIIAAECSTALLAPLGPILARHAEAGSDVTLVTTGAGAPAGLMVLRRSALNMVRARGYVDLKEQFLPALAGVGRRIGVVEVPERDAIGMHDRRGILRGVRRIGAAEGVRASGQGVGSASVPGPVIDPHWAPPVVSPSARVDGSAIVSRSLVMAGATIGAGACVARCIVGPGAVIRPGQVVIDRIVTEERVWEDEHLPLDKRRGTW